MNVPVIAASAMLGGALGAAFVRPPIAPVSAPTTWADNIAPVVAHSCASCHFPGGPAPFSLLTYPEAQAHAEQIAQVTQSRFMPPWLPTPDGLPLAHARRLTDAEIALFQQWSQQNAPGGISPAAVPAPAHDAGASLGKPSLTVALPAAYVLPAETTNPYRCFVLPLHLTTTHWLRALTFTPGNPVVVRQAEIFADTTGTAQRLAAESGAVGYVAPDAGLGPAAHRLAEWTVGSSPWVLPAGVAEPLPAHSDLVLLMRFETDGEPESVRSSVHLYFAAKPPPVAPADLALGSPALIIQPPQKGTVTDRFTLPVAASLLRLTPFGDPVCRQLQVQAVPANGQAETLLQVADWNADWQASYQPLDPPLLPAGTTLTIRWTVDDSPDNPRNPSNPPMTVSQGLQYEDEMATVRFQLLPVTAADAHLLRAAITAPRPAPAVTMTTPHRHG